MKRTVAALLVAAAAIACYAGTLAYGFAYDDKQLAMSPLIARPFDFVAVLRNEYYPPTLEYIALYRPLAQWTLLLNWGLNAALFGRGDVAWTFHAVNILLHASASVLVLVWLARLRLSRTVGFAAALLFAVHPIHSEAVANVTGRSEPQALVFGLLFLLAFRSGKAWLASGLLLLSLWSKESAAAFLPIAIAADVGFPPEETSPTLRSRFLRLAPAAAVLVGWFVLRALALDGHRPVIAYADNPVASAGAIVRVLTACAAQFRYLGLELLPLHQSPDYAFAEIVPVERVLDPRVIAFLLVASTAALAAFAGRRRAPVVWLCVLGYALAFSSTSNFLFPIGTILAERLAYVPSLFVCILIATGFETLSRRAGAKLLSFGVPALCVAGVVLTVRQNRVWRDEGTFVREAVRASPRSAKAHRNLGTTLEQEGDLEGAEREFAESVSIHPGYGRTWLRLGIVRIGLRRYEEALVALHAAAERMPEVADAWVNLAEVSLALRRRGAAIEAVHGLLEHDPAHKRLAGLQDRLAESAAPEERAQALDDLAASERALAAGDARSALPLAQKAVAGCALQRAARERGFAALARCWEALGRPDRAQTFREIAARLGAP